MAYQLLIEDERGDAVDALPACSRGCAHDIAEHYSLDLDAMLYPSDSPEFDTWCIACGVIIGGTVDESLVGCDHRFPVVVNRLTVDLAEVCEHGITIQQPRSNTIWEDGISQ